MTPCGWSDSAVIDLLHHLSPRDIEEVSAIHGPYDPFALHALYRAALPHQLYFELFRATPFGPPLAMAGVSVRWPGCGSAHLLVAQGFGAIALPVLRHLKRAVRPAMIASGLHRIDCQSLATNTIHHRLIEAFGGTREATLSRFGRQGEDFIQFVWHPQEETPHVRRINPQTPQATHSPARSFNGAGR